MMVDEARVRWIRSQFEELAARAARSRKYNDWISYCGTIFTLDVILEDDETPGYQGPGERIPLRHRVKRPADVHPQKN
jgi:hypothetical protein